jgi:hypothetical protein
MAAACAWSVALVGLEGRIVEVEADIGAGLPRTVLVGLPDSALYAGQLNPAEQPSYRLTKSDLELTEEVFGKLDEAAAIAAAADPDSIENLESTPRPRAVIRRVPQI